MEDFFTLLPLWAKLLGGVFLGTFLWRIVCLFFVWGKGFRKPKASLAEKSELPGVSVVIPCRNRGMDLAKNLPAFLTQDYPNYQVVVVNNGSEDNSEDVLKDLSSKYPHLYYTSIPCDPAFISTRKMAMTLGVKASLHEWVVFSNPDCAPASDFWLNSFGQAMVQNPEVVFGPVLLANGDSEKRSFLRSEVIRDNLNRLGWASVGKVYKASRYNLAWQKSRFLKERGFADQLQFQGGDDDLFIQKIAQNGDVIPLWEKEAVVFKKDWESRIEWNLHLVDFLNHFPHYQFSKRVLLISQYLLEFFHLGAFFGLMFSALAPWALGLFLLEIISLTGVLFMLSKKMDQPNNLLSLVWLEMLYPVQRFFLFIRRKYIGSH